MDGEWHYMIAGKEQGPVSTAVLEQLIRRQTLRDHDLVRVAGTDEWLPVREIKALFTPPTDESESASKQAARLLTVTRPGSPPVGPAATPRENPLKAVITSTESIVSSMGSLFESAVSVVASGLGSILAWRRSKWTVAVILLVLLSILFKDFSFGGSLNQMTIDEMSAIWTEVDQFNGRQVADADWDEFRLQTSERVSELEDKLLQAAENRPILRSRYWTDSGFREAAARGHLIQAAYLLEEMLESPTRNEATQKLFLDELEKAHKHHVQSPLGPARPAVRANSGSAKPAWDPLFIAILLADVIGVVVFIRWLHTRRIRV